MNKELIKTYKAEFDHWLNGGSLLYRHFNYVEQEYTPWEEVKSNFLWDAVSIGCPMVVINDEYVELRKALAEGKVIEYNPKIPAHDRWDEIARIAPSQDDTIDNYRIKPEEPKFKVGDWLIEIHSGSYAKVLEVIKKDLLRVNLYDSNAIITTESTDFILWQPKLGEWCWFYNNASYDTPRLRRYVTTVRDTSISLNDFHSKHFTLKEVPSFENGISDNYNRWKHCEPFLGQLPTNIQGIK